MVVILTTTSRVKDWQALGQLNREALVARARAVGATRYRIYRNVEDAAQALIVAECPDEEAGQELCRTLAAQLGALIGGPCPDDRLWEATTLEGFG